MKILVTGGAGFIGSNIVKHLSSLLDLDGIPIDKIVVLDNLSTGNFDNIKNVLQTDERVKYVWGDITDLETCKKVTKGIDIVCHQAALGSVPRSIDNPIMTHKSNVDGFLNMLWSCKENGVSRFVYASSSSVYGDHPDLPKQEDKVGKPLSPYAVTKCVDELYGDVFYKCYGLQTVGLRYFNVFGPNQSPDGAYAAVIPKFIKLFLKNVSPTVNGDGSYSRDFTYVDNVVQANVLAMTTKNSDTFGQIFNIGAGGRISLTQLVDAIKSSTGSDVTPFYGDNRPGDIPHSNADVNKAKSMLGYDPKINFEKGIELTIDYFKKI